ncbi:TetR/AcrR family transcriptional regulator [Mycolicibacterium vaccae]|uniref:TetR/AcrR family transcriptional regulator n=1 Tax=Mycolicibacterium vaccae TaxID=1810 RepID=UPI003CF2FC91
MLDAAFDILTQSGVGGFSVDEVVRRSGVAKTTIYRHWPSREALVLDAASRISSEQPVPDTGSVVEDVTEFLTNLGHLLSTARWSSVVPSIVDVAERDEGFAMVHGAIQQGHSEPLRRLLYRAVERGQLPPNSDISQLVAALVGPLYYRRWFSREPIDGAFARAIATQVIGPGVS